MLRGTVVHCAIVGSTTTTTGVVVTKCELMASKASHVRPISTIRDSVNVAAKHWWFASGRTRATRDY